LTSSLLQQLRIGRGVKLPLGFPGDGTIGFLRRREEAAAGIGFGWSAWNTFKSLSPMDRRQPPRAMLGPTLAEVTLVFERLTAPGFRGAGRTLAVAEDDGGPGESVSSRSR